MVLPTNGCRGVAYEFVNDQLNLGGRHRQSSYRIIHLNPNLTAPGYDDPFEDLAKRFGAGIALRISNPQKRAS